MRALSLVAESLQPPGKMMGADTSLHADETTFASQR
jgi:hypothetical protein